MFIIILGTATATKRIQLALDFFSTNKNTINKYRTRKENNVTHHRPQLCIGVLTAPRSFYKSRQQRIDSAVQTVQSGTGGVKIVDEDLHRLKEIVKSREEQDREFQQREKRKGAVMFGEVTRLGKIVETSSERMGKGLSIHAKLFLLYNVTNQRLHHVSWYSLIL